MELIDTIRAEIATHQNEIDRLKTALAVIEQLTGKPVPKKGPLISVSGVSHQQSGKGGYRVPKAPKESRMSSTAIREKVLELLEVQPMGLAELKQAIGKKALATRSKNAVSAALNYLKVKQGLISQREDKRYALNAFPPQFPAPDIVEPETAPELTGEAA